ncbi:MAG: hypothetical protein AAFO74_03125 [Pseudomonadota bacterium]
MTPSRLRHSGPFGDGKWVLWAVGLSVILLLLNSVAELFDGDIPGLDDMMRLQQVRDLLDGQAWFLVDQSRLLTPEGGNMHWSRLPDIFLSALILIFTPMVGPSNAEAISMAVWPLTLLACAMILLSLIMQRLGVSRAGQVSGLLVFIMSAGIYSFWPGRIDHHGFVVVLTLGGFAAIASPALSARSGIVLAMCLAAAMSIAIESLPYVIGLIGFMGLLWICRGHRESPRLAAFGLALMAFGTVFYLFDAPGAGARRMVCDAYGTSHWAAFVAGGGLLTVLGVFGGAFETWPKRLALGGLAAIATLAIFVLVNPACLGDPYAAVPEQVREVWLDSVQEAKSIDTLIQTELSRVIWVFGFLSLASLATSLMIWKSPPETRMMRLGLGLIFGLSVIATLWQVRGQTFSHVFGAIGAGWIVGAAFDDWRKKRGPGPILVLGAVAIFMSPHFWQSVGARIDPPIEGADAPVSRDCVSADNFSAFQDLPQMSIHTPIDLGIPMLLRTPHNVFVGPYHRNVLGIERATDVLLGRAENARARLVDMGATHLAYCIGLNETLLYAKLRPESFAAQMNRGQVPDWLELVETGDTAATGTSEKGIVRLYRVKSE